MPCAAAHCWARAGSRLATAVTSTCSQARAAGRISSLIRAVERIPSRTGLDPDMGPQPLAVADLRLDSLLDGLVVTQDAILLDDDPARVIALPQSGEEPRQVDIAGAELAEDPPPPCLEGIGVMLEDRTQHIEANVLDVDVVHA